MSPKALLVAVFLVALTGCDPTVELGWRGELAQNVDLDCVERANKLATGRVSRSNFEGDQRIYPKRTAVSYFSYGNSSGGAYGLEVAMLPNGRVRHEHRWLKIGTDVSRAEEAAVAPLYDTGERRHCE